MGRAQKPAPGQHKHCERCFNRHCHIPVEPDVSCLVINCHLLCGATFHMCKEAEHELLCPLEQVPCLNSEYGCPVSMSRHKLAKHLQVCPASVVCCSMEWNRWPNVDSETTLHKNIMKENPTEECLDMALALQDQKVLFNSLNMVELFPETREPSEQEPIMNGEASWGEMEGAVGGVSSLVPHDSLSATNGEIAELSQEEREALAKTKEGMDLLKFDKWENIFSKEHAASALTNSSASCEGKNSNGCGEEQISSSNNMIDAGTAKGTQPQENQKQRDFHAAVETTGLAPWQDGVLERLKTAVDAKDYNMYLVHNGRLLIHFGQMPACTPKERDFVYGNLEAQEVKTVYTFKVPVSYCGKRARVGDAMLSCRPSEHKAVDTSDLGVPVEDLPKSDLIKTTLLCALERELKGHVISESRSIDGLFMDFATQTYSFEPEQFSSGTVLADLLSTATERGLHVELRSECVTRRHNKSSSAFTFTCNKFFRRDEFPLHFKNVHTDIQSCLDGWFQHRCPLAYLGCTFIQNHFRPPGQKSKLIYSQELQTFAIKPDVASELSEGRKNNHLSGHGGKSENSLTSLPLEVLQYIAGFLDSISLSQLSQVSILMRNICATLLQERGMVLLQWKKRYSHGGTSWRVHREIWQFSSLFSKIKSWEYNEVASMSEHLKTCPFNIVEHKMDPVLLTSMYQPHEQAQESLVGTFRARPQGRCTY
ncbi:F-box only protein 40 [Erinaceus europaeus]|uniref:F-box only protein 40 n=1 Tax=Erinaceus europaeus TaxID=9365 RepID=A0ABM3XZL3_ERIEU|nr:F-box only protein 40 [Erinaceus europaeus]XP_060054262.1 F-box only protein 40 [Erinaceus europaeus]